MSAPSLNVSLTRCAFRDRHRVSADYFVELRRVGSHLRGVEHVPGDGKYNSVAPDFGSSNRTGCDPCRVSRETSWFSAALDLVPVAGIGLRRVDSEHAVITARISSQAE